MICDSVKGHLKEEKNSFVPAGHVAFAVSSCSTASLPGPGLHPDPPPPPKQKQLCLITYKSLFYLKNTNTWHKNYSKRQVLKGMMQ